MVLINPKQPKSYDRMIHQPLPLQILNGSAHALKSAVDDVLFQFRHLSGLGSPSAQRLWSYLGWVALLWVLWSHGLALAQDHIGQRSWLEDPTGKMTWQDVQALPFQPYTGTLSKGFGTSAIWLKLRIDPNTPTSKAQAAEPLVLRIRPVYLDDIRVYDPLVPNGLAGVTGDKHHARDDKLQSLSFLVPIARGEQARDIWLRLVSTSTRQLNVEALGLDEINQRALTSSLLFAGYVGLIAVLAVWGIVYWMFSRDAVVGTFGVSQIAALLYALASLGHLRALWPHHWPALALDQTTTVLSITAVSAAIGFHVLLLREFTMPHWAKRLHTAVLALLPLKLCLLALGWPIPALQMNMFEVLLAPLLFLVSALAATGWNLPTTKPPALSRKVVVGFYSGLGFLLLGAALPGLGFINGTEIALYIVQLHGLVSAFFVMLMLQYRAHVMHKQQRGVAIELERSQLQTQQERTIREEQEQLLTMLAHELKTPLATMSMRLDPQSHGSREIRQAIRDMNAVIERCQQASLLGDQQLQVRREAIRMSDVVQEAASSCAQPARVELDLHPAPSLSSDRQLLSIVLNNLLENACKYAPSDTPIQIRLRTEKTGDSAAENIVLEVANQPGHAGWPDADKVFEKYYRSPQARRQAGTGLGLYLVRKLVLTLGGQIRYAPDASTVRFELQFPTHSA